MSFDGYTKFGQFLADVQKAGQGSRNAVARLKTTGHLEEGTDSLGGALVPEEFQDEIMAVALEESIVRPRAHVVPMRRQRVGIPTFVDTTHASSIYGGITCYWDTEGSSFEETNPALGQLGMTLHKLVGFCYTSNELLADGGGLAEVMLRRAFGGAVAYYADDAYINGTGAGQPLGILNAPCGIQVSKESGQTATTVVWDNVKKMDARLLPQSQRRAIWLINPNVKPQLYNMYETVTTSNVTANPVIAVLDLTGSNGMWLYGHQIIPTEKCKTLGTVGDLMLADFSQYVIGDGRMVVKSSPHSRFKHDETEWEFILRTDGQPIPASAITPANGTNTLSPFVKLQTRS